MRPIDVCAHYSGCDNPVAAEGYEFCTLHAATALTDRLRAVGVVCTLEGSRSSSDAPFRLSVTIDEDSFPALEKVLR